MIGRVRGTDDFVNLSPRLKMDEEQKHQYPAVILVSKR
jgi:hypothetical protein